MNLSPMLATEFLQFSRRIPLFSIFIPFLCLNIRQNKRTIAYLGIMSRITLEIHYLLWH